MNDETPETAAGGEVAVYEDAGGEVRVDVRLDRETVWLTQRQMAEVFDSTADNVGLHLRHVYSSGELEERATTEDFSVVRTEGSGLCVGVRDSWARSARGHIVARRGTLMPGEP